MVALFPQGESGHGRARVHEVHVEPVLVPVERHHRQLFRVFREFNTRDISILVQRHVERFRGSRRHVEHAAFHLGVRFPRLGVFKPVVIGIQLFVERLERKLLHLRLVRPHERQELVVRRELHQPCYPELLFIYPVGSPVDHLVLLPVARHLALGIEIELGQPYIIIDHVRHHLPVRRKGRDHLFACLLTQLPHQVTSHVVVKVGRPKRASIHLFPVEVHQHPVLIGTHQETLERVERRAPCIPHVKQRVHRFTGRVGELDHRGLPRIGLVIMHPIFGGDHLADPLRVKLTAR